MIMCTDPKLPWLINLMNQEISQRTSELKWEDEEEHADERVRKLL